jgi:hypothetical protein
MSIP